jgi:uncharacterized membrane protein
MFEGWDVAAQVIDELAALARLHGRWMSWNLVLALIPLALAFPLFRPGRRMAVCWWAGAVLFALFLPNAPYVLTDVIHLFDDIRESRSDLQLLGVYLPTYLIYFAVGVVSYGWSLHRLWDFVADRFSARAALGVELGAHLLCAIGVYLGRVIRLNSWEVFTEPRRVLGSVESLVGPFPAIIVAVTALTLLACSAVWRIGRTGAASVRLPAFLSGAPR